MRELCRPLRASRGHRSWPAHPSGQRGRSGTGHGMPEELPGRGRAERQGRNTPCPRQSSKTTRAWSLFHGQQSNINHIHNFSYNSLKIWGKKTIKTKLWFHLLFNKLTEITIWPHPKCDNWILHEHTHSQKKGKSNKRTEDTKGTYLFVGFWWITNGI